jgi:soluble lytic murein transglycosylase
LGLRTREAAARLKGGETGFILEAPAGRMGELARIHPSAPFYAGLLVRRSGAEGAAERGAALFEAALNSPQDRVREEAARELILPVLEKTASPEGVLDKLSKGKNRKNPLPLETSLRGAALYSLGRWGEIETLYEKTEPRNDWDRAIRALAALRAGTGGEEFPGLFLGGTPGAASRWAFAEGRGGGFFTRPGEEAAAAGRIAAARSSFGEALRHFRAALEADRGLFFRYPDLAGDLGRAFQFAGAGGEGLGLFLEWEAELAVAAREEDGPLRYRLLYYAGRMARQLGRHTQGTELFTRALALAPDAIQEDACIWYILTGALAVRPETAAAQVKSYLPRWNSAPYFADVLDQLSRYLTAKREWAALGEIFSLIRSQNDGAGTAKYAWILGRAVEEGFLSPAGAAAILGEAGGEGSREEAAGAFFRAAFEEGKASFYYRALSAARLGNTVAVAGDSPRSAKAPRRSRNRASSGDLEFLLGFFRYGGAALVPAYLEERAAGLSVPELRAVAEAFAGEELWAESIRLTAAYMARPDYTLTRRDLELNYPQPFAELIGDNARLAGLPPELLYGLIRTESAFVPGIVSRAGAVGLSQLMEPTARDMAGRIARRGGPDYLEGDRFDLTDPALNVHIGAFYLNYLIEQMESPLLALIAYNGGMGRVRRWRAAEPALPEDLFLETIEYPETREYGRRVLGAAAAYGYLYYGMSMEAVAAEILQ